MLVGFNAPILHCTFFSDGRDDGAAAVGTAPAQHRSGVVFLTLTNAAFLVRLFVVRA